MRAAGVVPAALAAGLALASCGLLPFGTPAPAGDEAARLEAAAARFAAQGVDDYTLTVRYLCECSIGGRIEITVADGDATAATTDGAALPLDRLTGFPVTVADMFADARSTLTGGGSIEGTYDAATGVPLRLLLDRAPDAIDDEVTVEVSGFVPH